MRRSFASADRGGKQCNGAQTECPAGATSAPRATQTAPDLINGAGKAAADALAVARH
jgi:hypothetical protein